MSNNVVATDSMIFRSRAALLFASCWLATLSNSLPLSNDRFLSGFLQVQTRFIPYEFTVTSNYSRFDIQVVSQAPVVTSDLALYLRFGSPIVQTALPTKTANLSWVTDVATVQSTECASGSSSCTMYAISLSPCELVTGPWYAGVYYKGTAFHRFKVA